MCLASLQIHGALLLIRSRVAFLGVDRVDALVVDFFVVLLFLVAIVGLVLAPLVLVLAVVVLVLAPLVLVLAVVVLVLSIVSAVLGVIVGAVIIPLFLSLLLRDCGDQLLVLLIRVLVGSVDVPVTIFPASFSSAL